MMVVAPWQSRVGVLNSGESIANFRTRFLCDLRVGVTEGLPVVHPASVEVYDWFSH